MTSATVESNAVQKQGWLIWLSMALIAVVIGVAYQSSIGELVRVQG